MINKFNPLEGEPWATGRLPHCNLYRSWVWPLCNMGVKLRTTNYLTLPLQTCKRSVRQWV